MQAGLIVMAVSGVSLLALIGLFRAEEKRGERVFLSSVRDMFDQAVLYVGDKISFVTRFISVHVIRMSVHYVIHAVLGGIIAFLHKAQEKLSHLQLRNRYIVKAVNQSRKIESHLEQLHQHKEETTLTEKEKKKRLEQ